MTEAHETFVTPLRVMAPEAMMASAQNRLAGWSRAWTQVAHGMMVASLAQMDAARALFIVNPADLMQLGAQDAPAEAAHHRLEAAREHFQAAVKACRAANDELADTMFRAAESLIDAMPDGAEQGAKPGAEPVSSRHDRRGVAAAKH
ncbi:MAG: hypothetical protein JSR21_14000 [Proteobacteria bacterium]|nr:hypothetical protein [Pseudomonadota bacterium]